MWSGDKVHIRIYDEVAGDYRPVPIMLAAENLVQGLRIFYHPRRDSLATIATELGRVGHANGPHDRGNESSFQHYARNDFIRGALEAFIYSKGYPNTLSSVIKAAYDQLLTWGDTAAARADNPAMAIPDPSHEFYHISLLMHGVVSLVKSVSKILSSMAMKRSTYTEAIENAFSTDANRGVRFLEYLMLAFLSQRGGTGYLGDVLKNVNYLRLTVLGAKDHISMKLFDMLSTIPEIQGTRERGLSSIAQGFANEAVTKTIRVLKAVKFGALANFVDEGIPLPFGIGGMVRVVHRCDTALVSKENAMTTRMSHPRALNISTESKKRWLDLEFNIGIRVDRRDDIFVAKHVAYRYAKTGHEATTTFVTSESLRPRRQGASPRSSSRGALCTFVTPYRNSILKYRAMPLQGKLPQIWNQVIQDDDVSRQFFVQKKNAWLAEVFRLVDAKDPGVGYSLFAYYNYKNLGLVLNNTFMYRGHSYMNHVVGGKTERVCQVFNDGPMKRVYPPDGRPQYVPG